MTRESIAFVLGPVTLSQRPGGHLSVDLCDRRMLDLSPRQVARLIAFLAEGLSQPESLRVPLDQLIGYFERPEDTTPSYDPGIARPCPICWEPLEYPRRPVPEGEVLLKTISLRWAFEPVRSYFYRAHKACYEGLAKAEQIDLDDLILTAAGDVP